MRAETPAGASGGAGQARHGRRAAGLWPLVLVFASFAVVAFAVYRPALAGRFIGDDLLYIGDPHVHEFHLGLLPEILDPTGEPVEITANYAPLHLLAHALEWRLWGNEVFGYHLVNVLVHALAATLLLALMEASGVGRVAALAGSAFFLVHPANVEAVAWISQLKSGLALCLSLGALLAFRRRPFAGSVLFALALLSKATASFALPVAAAYTWAWRPTREAPRRHDLGLALWALVFVAYAVPESLAFDTTGRAYGPPYPDVFSHLRTISAIGARYLWMAATGGGTSAFHHPSVSSLSDPWWWAGLAAAPFLVGRILHTLRRRQEEAAWWLGAAAAFAPVSQIVPFYYGMADRYLYFILPGLIGGGLLWTRELAAVVSRRVPLLAGERAHRLAGACALTMAALIALQFVYHARGRASLWNSTYSLFADSASQYPEGGPAYYWRALRATQRGDADEAFEQLGHAVDQDFFSLRTYESEPLLAPLRSDPRYHELMMEVADHQIAYAEERGLSSPRALREVAYAYFFRGDVDRALATLEEGIRRGGPMRSLLIADYMEMRRGRSKEGAGPDAPEPPP